MAQNEINGNDLLILVDRTGSGNYVTVGCLTTNTLTGSLTELDASSKCNPAGKWIPGSKIEQTITGEGFGVDQDGANTINSYTQLYSLFVEKVTFPVKFGKATPTTGDAVYAGTAFITQMDLEAPFDALTTFKITMRVAVTPITQTVTY